jgi:DNA-binding LacI/PurR family transcriptional regulator
MRSDPPPSQTAIAQATGLSRSTVSRALSNYEGTSEKTKELVRSAAERLGYRKNAIVSMLTAQIRLSRLQKVSATLGYVTTLSTPGIRKINATYHLFYQGAKRRAEELGYGLDLIWRKEQDMTSERFTKILVSRGIRGILIPPRPSARSHILLDWNKFSSVAIGHPLPTPKLHWAGAVHHRIMEQALRMVRKAGYRRIGFAVLPDSDRYANYIFSSRFLLYQTLALPRDRVPLLYRPASNENVDCAKFSRWIKRHKPEVLLCVGSRVPTWLKELGIKVPGDIAYADLCLESEDGTQAGNFERPEVIAASAVDLVVEQLHHNSQGIPAHPKSVLIEGKWVDGKTLPHRV